MRRIVLVGIRGSGKSSVGRRLAKMLSLPFFDCDMILEQRAGRSIPEIFDEDGEVAFRALEREVIASLSYEPSVVATGGGAVLDPLNIRDLRKGSYVFSLFASPETIVARIAGSTRPALTSLSLSGEVVALMRERAPLYRASADWCVDDGGSVGQVASIILEILRNGPSGPADREEAARFFENLFLPACEMEVLRSQLSEHPFRSLCAILGDPCLHSLSPQIYNHVFREYGIDSHYTWCESDDPAAVLDMAKKISMKGLSVTIPFKRAVIPLLDEVDGDALAIGAVNTVVNCGGRLYGSNTDWTGVRGPLEAWKGSRAVVFGAGGAAAAAVYALLDLDMDVTILNRDAEKAARLASRFECSSGSYDLFGDLNAEVVVNATPVGMKGYGGSLLREDEMHEGMCVFDLVYTPPETPLLAAARRAGCTCISGVEMFVHQACAQIKLITGLDLSYDEVRRMME